MTTAAIDKDKKEFKLPKLPEIGERVFFWPGCRTNKTPMVAFVVGDSNALDGNTPLCALGQGGMDVTICFPAGHPRLEEGIVRQHGCWSRDRLDLGEPQGSRKAVKRKAK